MRVVVQFFRLLLKPRGLNFIFPLVLLLSLLVVLFDLFAALGVVQVSGPG